MNSLILSVIIPTYNMEALLARCLDSFAYPALSNRLEVLVINDGSKDKSLEIANQYATTHPNIYRVIDKSNGNYGSCINRGLKEAKGKFFRILDADDWFEVEDTIRFVEALEKLDDNIDVIFSNFTLSYIDSSLNKNVIAKNIIYNQIYPFDQIDFESLGMEKNLCMHAITYRSDLLREVGLVHQEGISYTDIEYCYFPLVKAKNIIFLDINLYRYFLGRDGQTMSPASLVKNKMHSYLVSNRVIQDFVSLHIPIDSNRSKNLCQILKNPLHSYYATILILADKNLDDIKLLKEMDGKIAKHTYLYQLVNQFTYKKVPFVKIWHSLGLRSPILK